VFAALFAAQLGSNVGTFFQSVAAAWLMGDLTSSPALVALVQTAALMPVLLLGVPAGALADIIDRRKLLIGSQIWMVVASSLLAILTLLHHTTPASLLALTAALGLGSALMGPAWQAIQPDLVPTHEFGQAVALSSMTFNTGRAIGPALGGALVAAAGPGWAFVVNAASFLGVLAVLEWWKPTKTAISHLVESLPDAMRAGLRYSANSPALRAVLVRTLAFSFPAAAIQALLPTVVRENLGMGSGGYGILLGCFGIGAMLAAVLRPQIDSRLSLDAMVLASSVVLAACLLTIGAARTAWIVGPALFIGGMAWTTATVTTNIAAQQVLPWWVRARGLALYLIVISGGVAGGSAVWGIIAGGSLGLAHVLAAVTLLAGMATELRWKLRRSQGLDLRPANPREPIVTLDPPGEDGPVLVTVTYRVPESRHGAFAATMELIGRNRRRSGATEWGLYRDLVETDRFVETFITATWSEHLRQHQRRTMSFDELWRQVEDLSESEPAIVHLVSAYSPGGLQPVVAGLEQPRAGDGPAA
jgi:predicted MFS family arabinose efflux permease